MPVALEENPLHPVLPQICSNQDPQHEVVPIPLPLRAALDLAQVAVCSFRILAGLPVSSDRFANPAARR